MRTNKPTNAANATPQLTHLPHQNDHDEAKHNSQACSQADDPLANDYVGHDLFSRRCISESLDGTGSSCACLNGNAATKAEPGVGIKDFVRAAAVQLLAVGRLRVGESNWIAAWG
jgi:hypothetical protein